MKIIYVANVRLPTEKAHGLQIMKMCEAWGKENSVLLLAPKRINYIKRDPFEFYTVARNFAIKKIFVFDLMPLDKFLGKFSFWLENISFALFASARIFFMKADAVFSRDFWTAFFLSLLGKKVIYEIHDSPNTNPITKHAFKKIYKFVVTNRYKEEELMNTFGIQREKILVAPNGVDLEFFNINKIKEDCRRELNLPLEKKVVLYTGHLYSWKGADTLLEAASKVERDGIVTVFVGGTPDDVARFATQARDYKNIIILGHQDYKKIPEFLRAADVLVLPNTAKEKIALRETSPIKLFEYMASGRPMIVSDIPSIREIVSENEVIFFEADNASDLKGKIIDILENYDKFMPKAKKAKEVAKQYSWMSRASGILNFWQKL